MWVRCSRRLIASMTARRGRGWRSGRPRLIVSRRRRPPTPRPVARTRPPVSTCARRCITQWRRTQPTGRGTRPCSRRCGRSTVPPGTSSWTWATSAGQSPSASRSPMRARRCRGIFSGPARPVTPRRTLIFNNGSDGSVVGAWTDGIACALARGWNAMTFDGPGQNAALVRQGLAFRPDWEKVITPVVDSLSARADVDGRSWRCSVSARPVTGCPGRSLLSTASRPGWQTRASWTSRRRCSGICRT